MRLTRVLTTALTALALLGAGATPASADAVGAGAGGGFKCDGLHCIQVTMSMNVEPTGLGYNVVNFQCTAVAVIDPAATTIDSCSVAGESALLVPITYPGAYAKAVGTVILRSGASVTVCSIGHADFIETRLGAGTVSAGDCTDNVVIQLPLTPQ